VVPQQEAIENFVDVNHALSTQQKFQQYGQNVKIPVKLIQNNQNVLPHQYGS
jgi:hypothetical protein